MQIIKKIIKKILMMTIGYDLYEKKIFLVGNKLAFIQKKIKKIKNLKEVEFSVFSQWGDDGIINWLIQNIPIKNKVFLEIGTEDYIESNTRFLLKYRNWNGYIIEGNKDHVKNIKKQTIIIILSFIIYIEIEKLVTMLKNSKKFLIIYLFQKIL